jgi:hypothetical protein
MTGWSAVGRSAVRVSGEKRVSNTMNGIARCQRADGPMAGGY